jgi:predicted DNA-binding transcriptional regulator YafY
VSDIKIDNEMFDHPIDLGDVVSRAGSIWFDPHSEPFEIRLFVKSHAADAVCRAPLGRTQRVVGQDGDGSIELSLWITHPMEIVPQIKSWIPHIVVLEPKWLARRIKKEIKDYLELIE